MEGGNKTDRRRQPPSPADPRHTAYCGRITGTGDPEPVQPSTPAGPSRPPGFMRHWRSRPSSVHCLCTDHGFESRMPRIFFLHVRGPKCCRVARLPCTQEDRVELPVDPPVGRPPAAGGEGGASCGMRPCRVSFTQSTVPWANRPSRHPLKVEIPGSTPGGTANHQQGRRVAVTPLLREQIHAGSSPVAPTTHEAVVQRKDVWLPTRKRRFNSGRPLHSSPPNTQGLRSSTGRAAAFKAVGCGFEPRRRHQSLRAVWHGPGLISLAAGFDSLARDHHANVAQPRQRHVPQKHVSVGSNPTVGTTRERCPREGPWSPKPVRAGSSPAVPATIAP